MRVPNLIAATALAVATCIGIVHNAEAAKSNEVEQQYLSTNLESSSNVDFNAENNNKFTSCEEVNLVCHRVVIDTIHLCHRPVIVFDAILTASNNNPPNVCSAKKCVNIASTVFIDMDQPCYKKPPHNPAFPADALSEGLEPDTESEADNSYEDNSEEDNKVLGTDLNNDQSHDETSLSTHHKHHKHRKHGKHHHKGGHHHHGTHRHHRHRGRRPHLHQSGPRHPWAGLCVSTGTFCGNQLFGYNFAANAVYTCYRIGVPPTFTTACVGGCCEGQCISIIEPVTATSSAAVPTPTSTHQCFPLIKPIKDAARSVLVAIENLPLGPEASKLLKIAVGTNLTGYFDNGMDSAGSTAALLAVNLPQIVDVIKGVQTSLGPVLGITDPAFQILYNLVGQLTKASQDLAACTGARVDCTGMVILTGYTIKIAMPIIRAYLTYKFPPAAIALIVLQPMIDKISDGLIAGDDKGITDLLKLIVDSTTGAAGAMLPAPLKAILDITKPILSIIKNCNNATPTVGPITTGEAKTTPAPTSTNGVVTTGAKTTEDPKTTEEVKTTGEAKTTSAPTSTNGVVTTGSKTTSSAITTPTPTPDCLPLIGPVKDTIRGLLSFVENLPLGPEASQLLKIALGTNLTAYFDNGIDSAGSIAALLANTLPQIVDVIKGLQTSLGPVFGIADPAFQLLYGVVGQITKASQDLAACTGAKVNCTGLVPLAGYAIKIGMPIVRAYLTVKFPPAAVALAILQPTIDKIANGLIAGNDAGITDLLKTIVDATTGPFAVIMPAPLKAILDVIKPILSIIKNCDSVTPTIGPVTTGEAKTTSAPTSTNGVVTTGAKTTSSAITTPTPTPDCLPLIGPVKDTIRGLLSFVENLPLGPEASQLLKIALGTNLTAYFDNGIDSAGSIAALLANTLPQIVDVIKGLQTSLGPVFGIADPAFQLLYGLVGQITKASQDLAACTGAKVNCTGLVPLAGYAIKIGMPIVRAYLTVKFPPAALALAALQPTIDKIADGLIAGNDAGITDLLTFIVNSTTGAVGALLPAPLKAILDIIKPILSIIKNCNNVTPTIGPVTTGEAKTTSAPTSTNGVVTTGAKTTSSAITTPTPTPDCLPLIGPVKDTIRGLLSFVENLPLGPEASQLLKIALGTNLTAYFDNGIDSAGSIAALLANTLPQIVDVIKGLQTSLGPVFGIADPAFQLLYGLVGQITKAAQDLAACTGAKVNCTGLVPLAGYAIKIGMPIVRAYLTVKFPPAALALVALQPTIDKIADGLIAGNDAGITDLLTFIVNSTTGPIGSLLPAPLKAILDVIKAILSIIKDCNNITPTVGPVTTGEAKTTTAPTVGPVTTGEAQTTSAPTITSGVVTTVTTTTTASSTTATPTPDCLPLIEPVKDTLRGLLSFVENLPLGPEASQLLKIALGTNLTAYFDNGIDSAGSIAALLANTLPQIVDVIKGLQTSLGPVFGIADPAFQILYDLVGQLTKASQDLAACTGAKVNCTGLVVLSGYAIKIGMPIVRAYLTYKFPPAAVALALLQPTIDKIADGLIAGNDAGITDLLKTIVDAITGPFGSLMPAPLKAILDVIAPILNIIKDCPTTQT